MSILAGILYVSRWRTKQIFLKLVLKNLTCVVHGIDNIFFLHEFASTVCFHGVYPFPKQAPVFTCLQHKTLENTVGKGEIARDEQFLIFFTLSENYPTFSSNSKLSSANSLSLEKSKICRLGKGYADNHFSLRVRINSLPHNRYF